MDLEMPDSMTEDEEKGIAYIIDAIKYDEYMSILLEHLQYGRTFKNIAKDRGYSYRKASAVLKKDLERLVNSYYIGLIFGYEKFIKTTSVKDLRLSKRSMLALIRNNINTLADIRAIGCAKLKALRFIGDESYNEIIFKTWFLWDSERQVKLSARYKDNIKAILTEKGWKAKEIRSFIEKIEDGCCDV